MDWKMQYLAKFAPKEPQSYQLAVEYEYLVETYDRSNPHTMRGETAFPIGAQLVKSFEHAEYRGRQLSKKAKELNLSLESIREHRDKLYEFPYERLVREYEQFEGKYLLGD